MRPRPRRAQGSPGAQAAAECSSLSAPSLSPSFSRQRERQTRATQSAALALDPARKAYVQVLRGALLANGQALGQGDALLIQGENRLDLDQAQAAEVLVFDLTP